MRTAMMGGRRWHLGIPLLALVAGCGVKGEPVEHEAEGPAESGTARVTVLSAPARLGAVASVVEGLGRCEALPDHIATLTPAVEGHVHDLLVRQGDPVQQGQPIVELDRVVALADLAEKTASRDGLVASLALLKSVPRPEERRANELAVEQAEVASAQAAAVVERLRPLRERREVSEQQLYDARVALEQARIREQAAEATLRAMLIGPRPEAVAEAEGKIRTADALVAYSKAHLDFHTIRAPIDGVLESLTCHPGQTIAIGGPVGEVVDTRQVFAAIWLAPRSAPAVRVGQPAQVRPQDIAGLVPEKTGADTGIPGKVVFVGRVADPQTGNLPIRVLVDNPEGRFTIGQSVRVAITVAERADVLQVPAVAVLDLGEGPVLNVVRDGKTIALHPEVGPARDGWVEVGGTDLKVGEPVIVEGGYNLPEGTAVTLAPRKAEAPAEPRR